MTLLEGEKPYLFALACDTMFKLFYNLIQNRFNQLFHAEEEKYYLETSSFKERDLGLDWISF